MKQRLHYLLLSIALIVSITGAALVTQPTQAIDVFSGSCNGQAATQGGNAAGGAANTGGSSSSTLCGAAASDDAPSIVKSIINTMLYILGIIAVIMIVIGGIRYTTSNGDASNIKSAKDTILYAVVGLVVAIMAFAIVNFVVTNI